ncbi:MAG: hypothetical protein A2622_07330 [Bdellovibrionales bacterium RIFCSPHIGHO2_01_FULL_40_29]|nr:MAG: hypothetical protein A2622_07330 [Bdellovibrionales bacterium RIFCSPHIGHO2_01_FULL_40_29]
MRGLLVFYFFYTLCVAGLNAEAVENETCLDVKSAEIVKFEKKKSKIILHDKIFGRLSEEVHCGYLLKTKDNFDNMYLLAHLCPKLTGKIEYIRKRYPADQLTVFGSGALSGRKNRSRLSFIWQKSECSEASEILFNAHMLKLSPEELMKNKFHLVFDDKEYQTYYANPGFVVRLEKNEKLCKKNKNCKLNIVLKKRLSSAILDAEGKLHTDESL